MGKVIGIKDGFTNKSGFILACIGSAVGMGNIWRFPALISAYGGLTFLIPYIIFVILIGSTGLIGEIALGRAAGSGPVEAFGMCTGMKKKPRIGKGIGAIPVAGSLALAIGYTCVLAWIIKYAFMAISGGVYAMGSDMDAIGGTFGSTASAWGANIWIIIGILISFIIMSFGIARGIEKANKIMMPVLFILLAILAIYIGTLPNASEGYKYIFSFNGAGLANPTVWIFAFGQAFFSLSVAGNGSVIYGSYLSKKESIPSSARSIAAFDTIAALLASMVIIPAMAAGGAHLESGGPGLMFIYLVKVFNEMPAGRIIGIIFYVAVLFAGVSSIINLYEAPVEFLQKKFGINRRGAVAIILVIGCVIALLIQAIVSGWMDVVSIYICPIGALLAGIMLFWVAGKKFTNEQVNLGSNKPIGAWFYPMGKYVYCIAALTALVLGAVLGGIG